ncbi:hypothetical protein [Psychroserpens algicola]|uniref:hypothetical protein n=1 Tax=Psychroserpens algicola TaxID=1719034 RepID=UPI001954B754|nr:hypothetical protein [Psychroserpens algicola]
MGYYKGIVITGGMFLILISMACNSNKKDITIQNWLKDYDRYQDYISNELGDCNLTRDVFNQLKLEEFKEKLYGDLAYCSKDDKVLLKKYLLKNVSSGLHPSRVDSIAYASVYNDIKNDLNIEHHKFWKEQDTSYFSEVEARVFLDQQLYRQGQSDTTNYSREKRISVFKENTKYLLEYCKQNGFPFKPGPRNFDSFRVGINPTVIAIHAEHKDKVELLNYAVEAAKQGKISWHDPISICITFHTNSIKRNAVKPIHFLHFNEDHTLDVSKSYLQLYSIAKLYSQDMTVPIKIQPSKFNQDASDIVSQQLEDIKNILVNEFSYKANEIQISKVPNENEKEREGLTDYKFTLTEILKNQ